jgi:hypothetical protein
VDRDISSLLDDWDYKPGQVVARRIKAKDGTEKIQLRVDLGLLQMNAEGRPDGKKPFGYPSLLEYYQARLYKHVAEHDGLDHGFTLGLEDCAKLQLEMLQYHHRYICLLELEDYASVIRDTERNLALFKFIGAHTKSEEAAWSLLQFAPQCLMMRTRAAAAQALKSNDYDVAIREAEDGIEKIKAFFQDSPHPEFTEQSREVQSLQSWLDEIRMKRPLSRREQLERALHDAVKSEDYERAARVRDQLKNLEPTE